MTRDDSVYIKHMLDAIADIRELAVSLDEKAFLKDKRAKYAVARCIEVLGEASKHLSLAFREKHPEIAWKDIAGMRDKLIHDYAGVDYSIVWKVIEKNIPDLEAKLKKLV